MPLKKYDGSYGFPTPPEPEADPTMFERVGGLPGLLAGGTRAVSGGLASMGWAMLFCVAPEPCLVESFSQKPVL